MSRTDYEPKPADWIPRTDDRLGKRVLLVCEAVGEFIEYWGFKTIHGRVWCYLALSRAPRSQVEIADFLGVSRSLVSASVAELTKHHLVKTIGDHHRAPYEAILDIWPTVSDVLRRREWMLMESARVALEGAVEEAELRPIPNVLFDVERMRFLLRMTELAQAFLKLLIGMRMPRKLEGIGSWLKSSAKFIRSLREL